MGLKKEKLQNLAPEARNFVVFLFSNAFFQFQIFQKRIPKLSNLEQHQLAMQREMDMQAMQEEAIPRLGADSFFFGNNFFVIF